MTTTSKQSSPRKKGAPRTEGTTPRLRSIEARLLFGFALMLGATLLVGLLHRRAVENLEATARWVEHSRRVHAALDQMMGALADAESGQRGYLLTKSDAYLDPYTTALPRVRAHQRELRELVADAPDQLARLEVLDATIARKLAEMRELIEVERASGEQEALRSLKSDRGLRLMEEARRDAIAMARREEELLAQRRMTAARTREAGLQLSIWATLASGVLVLIAGTLLARSITRPLADLALGAEAIRQGDFTKRFDETQIGTDELGALARAFNGMASSLAEAENEVRARRELDAETARLVRAMQGHVDVAAFAERAMPEILAAVHGLAGAFFVNPPDELDDVFRRIWAHADDPSVARTVKNGDGLHGQAAASGKALFLGAADTREGVGSAVRLRSALTTTEPAGVAILPFAFEGRTLGVLEIVCGRALGEVERTLLTAVAETGGRILRTFRAGEETARLLREASDLADELQKQTEELQSLNQEIEEKHRSLENQRAALESSEVSLREQQDELSALNEELEEQARLASARNIALERKNEEILAARELVETKVEELRLSGQFKSQFLANVSHELRTPLNSQLILSRLLQENAEGNLTAKQQEYLRTIHRSGMELLRLVDDILDLAKIEAGRLEIATEETSIVGVLQEMDDAFREVARAKDLSFVVAKPRPHTPAQLRTDPHRLRQILKNLIGNAIKFTEKGEVVVEAGPGPRAHLGDGQTVVFRVRDTGIGMSDEQRAHVFEAFRQGDGSTSRVYGGTGLGLTISRELTALLGGEIHVESKLGEGSVFSLVLTQALGAGAGPDAAPRASAVPVPMKGPVPVSGRSRQQRETTLPGTIREAVIVTNDEELAAAIASSAEDSGFALVRIPYDAQAHAALRQRVPSAVVLAPDGSDMETASLLRTDLENRKLPLHFVGSLEEPRRAAAEIALFFHRAESQRTLGRRGTEKDAVLQDKRLLLVDDDMRNIFALTAVLEREGLIVSFAEDGEAALQVLANEPRVDAILMDLMMPKMDGLATTEKLRGDVRFAETPIIAVTAKAMQGDRERCLAAGASDYITKPVNVDQLLSLLRVWLYKSPTTQTV